MAKVLRTHKINNQDNLVNTIENEIVLLTRSVACPECVEILVEKSLFDRACPGGSSAGTMLGYKFRVVHGPGVRPGSLAVITRAEILFK